MLDHYRINAAGFRLNDYPDDVTGWGSDAPIFGELIIQHRPRLIIEVGTWKGASAIHMASICDDLLLDTPIVCIDTWLGALEFMVENDPTRDLQPSFGYPQVYYQFLANVIRAGYAERIIPIPQTSLIAARYLMQQGVHADLIYLDGSHDTADVRADLLAYLPLLSDRGVLFGDDFDCWPSVRAAVEGSGLRYDLLGGRYWVVR